MSKRPKIFEDELRAKKVYTKIEKASNLPKNYNKKTNQGLSQKTKDYFFKNDL